MKCLWCHKEIGSNPSLKDILLEDDILCRNCRKEWIHEKKIRMIDQIKVESYWVYNEAFQKALIQFKECKDEALKDVFLYPLRNWFRYKYFGYTLVLLPSSKERMEERGFSHLREMFEIVKMPMIEPFEKISVIDQKKKNKLQRENIKHNIHLKKDVHLPDKLLLVDDVLTTGSTMIGGFYALNGNYKKLKCFTCANVDKK